MRLHHRRATIAAVLQETFAVEVHLHQDPEGKDRWLPQSLAKKLVGLIKNRRELVNAYEVGLCGYDLVCVCVCVWE
jgi:hypothetical protein